MRGEIEAPLARAFEKEGLSWPIQTRAFCLGSVTAGVARAEGLVVAGVASEYTHSGLLDALVEHFGGRRPTEV